MALLRRRVLRIVDVMTDPLLRKVDCIALPVESLTDGLAFYTGLGHEVIWRTETAVGLGLPDSDAELVLQVDRPDPEVDLTVDVVEDAVDRFVAAGGRVVVEPFDIQIGRCTVVADPWGNRLVLLDNRNGR